MTRLSEFADLSVEDRRKLLRLVCSFAWVDHEIDPDERKFITRLIERMELTDEDRRDAIAWLDEQVTAEELAGAVHDVPEAHRQLFVDMGRPDQFETILACENETSATFVSRPAARTLHPSVA